MNNAKPIASGVGAVGADVRWGRMEKTGRYSYLALSPNTGALRAWLNGCNALSPQVGGSGGSDGTGTGNGQGTGSSDPPNTGSNSGGSGSNPGDPDSSGGSGNGGNGDNGSGNGSAGPSLDAPPNGNSLTGEYLGGGKEIPAAGLSALGLATVGIPAVISVTPYAITAQNDLTTANEALKALTAGAATSGGVLAAASAVEIAAKGQYPLSYVPMLPKSTTFSKIMTTTAESSRFRCPVTTVQDLGFEFFFQWFEGRSSERTESTARYSQVSLRPGTWPQGMCYHA